MEQSRGSIKAIGKGQAESGEGKKGRYEGNECIKLYKMSIPYSARHFFPSFSGQKNYQKEKDVKNIKEIVRRGTKRLRLIAPRDSFASI